MRKFLVKSLVYLLICSLVIISIYAYGALKNEPYVDAFYRRFTRHHNGSIVLGTSRAAQGIEPSILNNVVGEDFYNFSFTMKQSSFEKSYFEALKAFTEWTAYDSSRVTIISVDPWSIREVKSEGSAEERVNKEYLASYTSQWSYFRPNIKYLLKEKVHLSRLFADRDRYVNDFGRYVIPFDTNYLIKNYTKRAKEVLELYSQRPRFVDSEVSDYRLNYLNEIIDYCKEYGKVFLVRIPVTKEMYALENKLQYDFDDLITKISEEKGIPYINLINLSGNYQTVDGNHLWNGEVPRFSKDLASYIQSINGKR